jgi:hypothetical protein
VLKSTAMVDPYDNGRWTVSPAQHALGANTRFLETSGCDVSRQACANVGIGHSVNPATGVPYANNTALVGDYTRVLAEFWADGPQSDTPPRHWNTILNYLFDHPAFDYKWAGVGPALDPLEYQVTSSNCRAPSHYCSPPVALFAVESLSRIERCFS